MLKKWIIGIGFAGILALLAVGAYVLRPTAEASAPIEAIPVEMDQPTAKESGAVQSEMPAAGEETEGMSLSGETAENPDGVIVFKITPSESEVRFTLDELLSGVPTTVVGATDQVAGEIAIDPAAPANAAVGVILINARTFVTDNSFRNRAINNEILKTDEYEFVRFTPTAISGFPENPVVGEPLTFQITGDLTIRDMTNEVTFDVQVTAVSETRLEGSASAMVARADYDLQIPNVPRVADVDEEVLLEIDFVALAK